MRSRKLVVAGVVFFVACLFSISAKPAQAAQLNETYLRLDRMKASTATGGTVCAKMATVGSTDAFVKVTFPSGFTVNGTFGNWTVSTSNLPTGTTAWPGILTATAVSSQTVTFPSGDIATDSTMYCFNFASSSTLTNSTAGNDKTGSISVTDSGSTEIDGGIYATSIISDDQVVVTATVPATFTFALSTNTQALGTLSTGSVTSGTGVGCTFSTNASNGWLGWIKSANAALDSAATGDSIATVGTVGDTTPSTLSAGTEGYVVDADLTKDSATSGTGTVSINGDYNGGDTSSGGTLSAVFQEFATSSGPTDDDQITLIPRAAISALTQAGTDYTDTLTIVAAGNF
jgi:hypothetical protein